jgi:hypothetical protein
MTNPHLMSFLRHAVPKNLVPGSKNPSIRRTSFAEFSLRSPTEFVGRSLRPKGVGSEAEWAQHDIKRRTPGEEGYLARMI